MHGIIADRSSARKEKVSEHSEEFSEFSEAMRLVKLAAEPRPAGDSVKEAIRRAARNLGWEYSRTEDFWYGEVRRVDSCEMDALRAIEQQRDHAEADRERKRHLSQLAALRAKLQFNDADFHAEDIAALSFVIDGAK